MCFAYVTQTSSVDHEVSVAKNIRDFDVLQQTIGMYCLLVIWNTKAMITVTLFVGTVSSRF